MPKFIITDNNKVIESLYILDQNVNRISDSIHNKFLILQKKHNLLSLLDKLIVCTGPGSYTSLRVGISFMLGISYSRKIPIYGISCTELLSKFVDKKDFYKIFLVICSTNNQYYICLPINNKNYKYKIMKINNQNPFMDIDLRLYSKCITNYNLPDILNKAISLNIKIFDYINIEDKFYQNFFTILNNKTLLKPIYISDNKLFN